MTRRRLLAALALVPALLSGCDVPGLSTSAATGSAGSGADPEAAGSSWVVAAQGSATPSARPGAGAVPTPSPSFGFLPLSTAAPTPTRTPTPTCSANAFDFSKIGPLDVTPGATSAVLSWYNVGGDNLVEFRLYAISQDLKSGAQRDVGYVTVPPRKPCGQMNATIGNLDRNTRYVFSVDAVVQRPSGDGSHSATVARSHPVLTG